PELGFCVLHHRAELFSSNFVIHTIVIGTYPSFTAAQIAALDALYSTLIEYERAGLQGNVFKAINLVLRGLITKFGEHGLEQPLSEFEIKCVDVWGNTWGPQMGCEEEGALMKTVDRDGMAQIRVKVPSAKPIPMSQDGEQRPNKLAFREEADPHWSQSRIPYFRRRDDAPFRRSDNLPYSASFGFVGRSPSPTEQPIP
ncbi:hypothetical protein K458DRAFT_252681, partial [Lentithecium fluviatile CBS 122367]